MLIVIYLIDLPDAIMSQVYMFAINEKCIDTSQTAHSTGWFGLPRALVWKITDLFSSTHMRKVLYLVACILNIVNTVMQNTLKNEDLKQILLDTGNRKIGETGRDRERFLLFHRITTHPSWCIKLWKWKSNNQLGQILEIVRNDIRGI